MDDSVPYDEISTFSDIYAISIDEYEGTLVNDSPFSGRTINRLIGNDIATVSDLLRATPETLMKIKGFGKNCLDEVKMFCSKLKSEKTVTANTSKVNTKAVQKLMQENVEYVAFGDFSFANEASLNDEEIACLELYKCAFCNLGEELVFDCIRSPQKIIPIIEMFNEFQYEANRHREVYELVAKIPLRRKENIVAGYINAFDIDESKRSLLRQFFAAESSTIASIVSCVSFRNDEAFILLKKFLKWCTFDLREEIERLFAKLYTKCNVQTVIKSRARKQTLEQVGNHLGVTRERVRQIESKAKRNFARLHSHVRVISKISAERNGDSVLTPSEIGDYCRINAEELIYFLRSLQSTNYIYDNQLDVFIVGDVSLQDRVQNYLETLPDIINANQLSEILHSAKEEEGIPEEILGKAFMNAYCMTGSVHHRIRLSLAVIYTTTLSKHYPSGIKVYDFEEIKKFREHVATEYGDIRLPENNRALAARIASICVLCGRGIYTLKKNQYISEGLSERIHKYIVESKNSIFLTNTLFSVFEDELVASGVDNKYYLQGILRELFADEFVFRRDYISKDPNITSIYSTIVDYIKKSQYPVSKAQIQQAFPGVTEVVINFAISDPNILNYFGEYLHANNIFISVFEKEYLKALIEKVISDGSAHHGRDFYEVINCEKPELLTRNAAMIPFSAFSFLEHLFRDKYQFSRPYIAQNGVDIGRPAERLHDLIYSSDEFAISDISEFIRYNHFQIQSILEYVNSCNDQFLLVDSNTMMKIDKIGITEDMANEVEDIVFSEISATILIRQLSLWNILPSIAVQWTDWLIYSVLNKWGKKVAVSTTSNQFRLSAPLVAPAGKMDISDYKDFDKLVASSMNKVDNLDNIDELLEDIIGDEIWKVCI